MMILNKNKKTLSGLAGIFLAAAFFCGKAEAVVIDFSQDLPGFNASAGNPPISQNFDGIAAGTNISGQSLAGITFLVGNAPLIVVRGVDTFTPGGFSGVINSATNKLLPTSGENVLSPGGLSLSPGPNSSVEDDDVTFFFDNPVSAFGLDILYQSADGFPFLSILAFDESSSLIYSNFNAPIPNLGGGGAPGGSAFWGITSNLANIKAVMFLENDSDSTFPDANIGFDTLRYSVPVTPAAVPEPATMLMLGLGGVLGFWKKGTSKRKTLTV